MSLGRAANSTEERVGHMDLWQQHDKQTKQEQWPSEAASWSRLSPLIFGAWLNCRYVWSCNPRYAHAIIPKHDFLEL